jgi:hypothetical protein
MAEKVETVCLVSCVGAKGAAPASAQDLYQSDRFTKARADVEAIGFQWFILSAITVLCFVIWTEFILTMIMSKAARIDERRLLANV